MIAATANGIGKKDLVEALGWSRPTLDKRLKTDPQFPVVRRGNQSGGWEFNLLAVVRYLNGEKEPPADGHQPSNSPPAIDPAQLRDVVAPPLPRAEAHTPRRSADHKGEATARQRKDEAAARRLERLEAEAARLLVPASEMRQVLGLTMAQLGNDLDALPDEIVRRCGLPNDAAPVIRERIDGMRREMVWNLKSALGDA